MKWHFFFLLHVGTWAGLFAQFTDNFSDGDFSFNPTWLGNTADFVIDNFQLRTNGPAVTPTTIYLYTNSALATDAQWEFYVNPKCATSSGNYIDIILISDVNTFTSGYNGYFVRVGGTPDEVSLFRKTGNTELKIIDGTDGLIASSSNNPTRVKVIRDASYNWTLEADPTGTGSNYLLQGTVNDAVYTTGSFFGVLVTYSASNNMKYFFDDFYVGNIIYDTSPPVPLSANAISATQVDVLFDENVEQTTAENVTNYSVNNGIGNPLGAVRDGSNFKLVHLTFATPFANAQNYTLTINGVQDMAANAISNATVNFTYYVISPPAYREVVINEIMADPDPPVGLPNKEFVEILNTTSSKNFQLSGWKFTDGTTTATLSNYILLPGEYLILCAQADTALFSPYGNVMGLSPWPSLNNTGDNLALYSDMMLKVDAVSYQTSWYGNTSKDDGGWTLEQINPYLPCSGSDNWRASENITGGTPGQQNSIYSNAADTIKPFIKAVNILAQNQIEIVFSENMDSLSLAASLLVFNNGITAVTQIPVAPSFQSLLVMLSANLDSALVYVVKISGATDCSSNILQPDSALFAIGVFPQPHEIVIHEIFANPSNTPALPDYEFIEIYNVSDKPLLLNGLNLSDASSTTTLLNGQLLPSQFLILCSTSAAASYQIYGSVMGLTNWPSLNNSGDFIRIWRSDGTVIHEVNYSENWHTDKNKKAGGWSLEMKDPHNPCGEENNWGSSVDPSGGTPGKLNSISQNNPDIDSPKLVGAFALADSMVELTFDEKIDSLTALTAMVAIDNGVGIISRQVYYEGNRKKLLLVLMPFLQPKVKYTVTVNGFSDCIGNSGNSSISFYLPEQAEASDIIINEVLFNPRGEGSDFVEIYNNSEKYINLQGYFLANLSDGKPANYRVIADRPLLLIPGEFYILTKDSFNIIHEYPNARAGRFIQMNSMPSYPNASGNVLLLRNDSILLDRFDYTEEMHFPLLSSFEGVSLERIRYDAPTQDPANWHSAAETVGFATPGYENSQHNENPVTDNFAAIPDIFSPDNDGYQDILTITYQLDKPGYVANVHIFDREGRNIRHLVKNELLGLKGYWNWDGITDRGEKASLGIYVVYIEVFDVEGKIIRKKIPVVVAGVLRH